ncbi:MAG: DUF4328 domain-containing protein [Actinomycetota bacterium]
MSEPVRRGGTWWRQREDATWLRWDPGARTWEEQSYPPPEDVEEDIRIEAAPPPLAHYRSEEHGLFEPLADKSRWVTRLLWVTVAISVIAVISDAAQVALVQEATSGGTVTQAEADANDSRQGAIGLMQGAAFAVTAGFFLVWFHAAYANLPRFGAAGLRYKTWWAVGGWLIPIVNFFRPKQIANDIWRASEPAPAGDRTWRDRPVPALLGWWWAAWLASGLLSLGATGRQDSLDDLEGASTAILLSDAAVVAAGVLAYVVVKRITERQEEKARVLAAQ